MNIGQIARKSGLPAKTIRYYEDIGLIAPSRCENGYRDFRDAELHKLTFLRRARSLGFSIERCRDLISLYEDPKRSSADVKRLTEMHLGEISAKIAELRGMYATLEDLLDKCQGNERPDCPILDDLGDNSHEFR